MSSAAASSRISRYLYSENGSSGRYALDSYQDMPTAYSQSRGLDAEANVHETYEYPSVSGYKHSYSELVSALRFLTFHQLILFCL